MQEYEIISERQEAVLRYLEEHGIPFTMYNHPGGEDDRGGEAMVARRRERAL